MDLRLFQLIQGIARPGGRQDTTDYTSAVGAHPFRPSRFHRDGIGNWKDSARMRGQTRPKSDKSRTLAERTALLPRDDTNFH